MNLAILGALAFVAVWSCASASEDYYSLLGVPRTASQSEIKKAFRKLARIHHPDRNKDKKAAEKKFIKIARGI